MYTSMYIIPFKEFLFSKVKSITNDKRITIELSVKSVPFEHPNINHEPLLYCQTIAYACQQQL